MEIQNSKIQNVLKKMKSPNFVYLTVFFIFVAIVSTLFLISTNFIVKSINKIFFPTSTGTTQALDLKSYSAVVKKLGLPINVVTETVSSATSTTKSVATQTVSPVASTLSLKSVTLSILNSTAKKGVAAALATSLEQAGFSNASTGNQKKLYPITTIIVKDSKKEFTTLIENTVRKTYPKAVSTVATGTEAFDVTIIIGAE